MQSICGKAYLSAGVAPRSANRISRKACVVRCQTQSTQQRVETVELGKSGLHVPQLGIGAWSWGDRSGYWGQDPNRDYGKDTSREAYDALLETGLNFIDTAEVYGFGKSEAFLGEFMRSTGSNPIIATKYAPLPWRLTGGSVPKACKASLQRLGKQQVDLYMQHWPGFFPNAISNDAYLAGLADCVQLGLTKAIGVSNFNAKRLKKAAATFKYKGVNLASNQVQYSLLYRWPETNGVFEACKENDVTLVAYSPMCQGLLTGKYTPDGPRPYGVRGATYAGTIKAIQPLIEVMRAVGQEHGGKTPAQVALNWVMCKGAVPIAGAKNGKQVQELAGAVGWKLTDGEVAELERVVSKIPTPPGAPFENW